MGRISAKQETRVTIKIGKDKLISIFLELSGIPIDMLESVRYDSGDDSFEVTVKPTVAPIVLDYVDTDLIDP